MHMSLSITSWAQFDRYVRYGDNQLLAELGRFPAAILVAGCQRSGTTIVSRILREAMNMPPTQVTKDDELDAALILSGTVEFETSEQCCFQTTYLNDHFAEYFDHQNYRLIWVVREPEAVVRSMLLNWRRGALNRLFRACGKRALGEIELKRFNRFGTLGVSRLDKACLSYVVKTAQVHHIAEKLGPDRLYLLEYDDLLNRTATVLPDMFSFASLPYNDQVRQRVSNRDRPQKSRLSAAQRKRISDRCQDEYERATELVRHWTEIRKDSVG